MRSSVHGLLAVGALALVMAVCLPSTVVHARKRIGVPLHYPNPKLPQGNTTVFAIAEQSDYLNVFALGADGALYHKYQALNQNPPANWSEWIVRARAPAGSAWDADPAVGVAPDGTMEVFIRELANLDLWQIYQTDASDPNAWSKPRECTCVETPCNDTNPAHYWNKQPVFPTSDVTITNTGPGGALRLFYRGFDGGLYVVDAIAGSNHQYGPAKGYNVILE